MYKIMACLIIVFVLACFATATRTPTLLDKRSEYRIYTYAPTDADCIRDAFSGERILTVPSDRLPETLSRLGSYTSYETSVVGNRQTALDAIEALGGRVIKQETRGTGITFYAFSPRFRNSINLDGEVVNLHVIVSGDTVTIATPIIRGCC